MKVKQLVRFLVAVFIFYSQSTIDGIIEPYLPSNFTISLELAIIGLIVGKEAIYGKPKRFFNLEIILLVCFVTLNLLSLYVNGNFHLRSQYFRMNFVFIFLFLAIYDVATELTKLRYFLMVLVLAYLTRICITIFQMGMVYGNLQRVGGNNGGILYMIGLILSLYFIKFPFLFRASFYKLLAGLFLLGLLFTFSRGAIISLVLTATFYLVKEKKFRRKIVPKIILALSIFLMLMPNAFWDRMALFESDRTGTGRIYAYQAAFNAIKANPLLGIGEGNFRSAYSRYAVRGDVFLIAFTSGKSFGNGFFNDFLDIAAKNGLPALMIYLLFIRRLWKNLGFVKKICFGKKNLEYERAYFLSISLKYSVFAYLIGGLFLHNIFLYLAPLFATAAGLKKTVENMHVASSFRDNIRT